MQAPVEILDFLESILSIFFYDIKHKERSVFILVDNLVELSCKARLRERNKQFNHNMELKDILKIAGIGSDLKKRLIGKRKERNTIQHDLVSVTVSVEHCTDSILDLCSLLKKLWGKYALDGATEWIICALRIVRLYSRTGDARKRVMLESILEKEIKWNEVEISDAIKYKPALEKMSDKLGVELDELGYLPAGKRYPRNQEIIIAVGSKKHWTYLLKFYTNKVSMCLDELEL